MCPKTKSLLKDESHSNRKEQLCDLNSQYFCLKFLKNIGNPLKLYVFLLLLLCFAKCEQSDK